jgi:hypothetical protein
MAKNQAIVPITAPNQNNAPDTLIDAQSLEKFISNARTPQLLKKQDVLFSKISKFFSLEKQAETYRFLLTKSLGITDYNFKMKLFCNAVTAINYANTNAHLEVKDKAYTEMVTILNNGLRMKCQPENSTIKSLNWNTLTEDVINNLLKNNEQKALNLAQLSLDQRTKILLGEKNYASFTTVADFLRSEQEKQASTIAESPKNQEAIIAYLQACNKIAELANKSYNPNIQIKGLQKAEELYNVATICNDPEFRSQALIHMANLHRLLGDNNKAATLAKEAQNITSDNPNTIKTFGITDAETINIKQQIKEETLDPIYQAASSGKWTNMQLTFWGWQEQGAQKYIPQKLQNDSEVDYNTKMALIFESIILAINNSDNHDPTCAIIFAQKYPDIIKYVIEHHPEYFVNPDMLHICAEKLDIKELQKLTDKNEPAPSGYKSYQEKAIIPFIEKRLTTDNIIPKAKGLSTGAWDHSTKTQLLTLFQDLTIGNNLGAISDSIDIARSLLIKAVSQAITDSKSVNFAPFQKLCNKYPVLIKEISAHHPEYLGDNKFILDITKQVVTQEEKEPVIHHLENEWSPININTEPIDNSSNLTGQEGVSTEISASVI